jgi:outer membrane lipoprotein-sorting protein
MKNILLIIGVLLLSAGVQAQKLTGEQVFDRMQAKYNGKWHHNLTFVQTTEQYAYEQINSTQTWYEAIEFPGNLRIDIGDTKNGNMVIFHNDSLFKYQNDSNIYARDDFNSLVFLIGGMYFYDKETAKAKLIKYKYDLTKTTETKLNGKDMYVIGTDSIGAKVNQLWVDKENLLVNRIIEYDGWFKLDFIFEGHKQFGNSWVETKVTIYQDDKKAQAEYYKDIRVNQPLDPRVFDPRQLKQAKHWYGNQ